MNERMDDTIFSRMNEEKPQMPIIQLRPQLAPSPSTFNWNKSPQKLKGSSSHHPSQGQILGLLQNKNNFKWDCSPDQPRAPGYDGVGVVRVSGRAFPGPYKS